MDREGQYPKYDNIGLDCLYWSDQGMCIYPKFEIQGRTECEGIIDGYCTTKLGHGIETSVAITASKSERAENEDRDDFIKEYFEAAFEDEPRWIELETLTYEWRMLAIKHEDRRMFIAVSSSLTDEIGSYCLHLDSEKPDEYITCSGQASIIDAVNEIQSQIDMETFVPHENEYSPLDELIETLRLFSEIGTLKN